MASKPFRLTIDNENLAAWMAVNNSFALPAKRIHDPLPQSHWTGVLIQLGRYRRVVDNELIPGFGKITFSGGEMRDLLPSDFEAPLITWINVFPNGESVDSPMRSEHVSRLLLGEQRRDFVPPATLHRFLTPYPGGITLWYRSGYHVHAERKDGKLRTEFVLDDCPDGYQVDVWQSVDSDKLADGRTTLRKGTRVPTTGDFDPNVFWGDEPHKSVVGEAIRVHAASSHPGNMDIHKNPPQRP